MIALQFNSKQTTVLFWFGYTAKQLFKMHLLQIFQNAKGYQKNRAGNTLFPRIHAGWELILRLHLYQLNPKPKAHSNISTLSTSRKIVVLST